MSKRIVTHRLSLDLESQKLQATITLGYGDTATHRLVVDLRHGADVLELSPGSYAIAVQGDGTDVLDSVTVYSADSAYPNCLVYDVSTAVTSKVGVHEARFLISRVDAAGALQSLASPKIAFVVKEGILLGSAVTASEPYSAVVLEKDQAERAARSAREDAQKLARHNTDPNAHADIRKAISDVYDQLQGEMNDHLDGLWGECESLRNGLDNAAPADHTTDTAAHSDIRNAIMDLANKHNADKSELEGKLEKHEGSNALKANVLWDNSIVINDISPLAKDVMLEVRAKNLFDISKLTFTQSSSNCYITGIAENSIIIQTPSNYSGNGYTTTEEKLKDVCPTLKAGDVVTCSWSVSTEKGGTPNNFIYFASYGIWTNGQSVTITEAMLEDRLVLYGSTISEDITTMSNLQIELGAVVTPYVPHLRILDGVSLSSQGKEYELDSGGRVSIPATYPTTVIVASTPEVVVKATYNRDINTLFDSKVDRVSYGVIYITGNLNAEEASFFPDTYGGAAYQIAHCGGLSIVLDVGTNAERTVDVTVDFLKNECTFIDLSESDNGVEDGVYAYPYTGTVKVRVTEEGLYDVFGSRGETGEVILSVPENIRIGAVW